jgi:hypothetical protein
LGESPPTTTKKQGEKNMITDEIEMNENEHALERFLMMLNVIDNGDCVEDFSDPKIIANIRTLTVLLRQYIKDQNDEIQDRAMLERLFWKKIGESEE